MTGMIIDIGYIVASILFILGIKMLSKPDTAVKGNAVSALGMLIAVIVTLLSGGLSYTWILAGILVGSSIGAIAAQKVQMTAMPQLVALFNGFGGIASLIIGWTNVYCSPGVTPVKAIPIFLAVLIGGVAFSGSLIAYGKLAEKLTGKPVLFPGQKWINSLIVLAILVGSVLFIMNPLSPNSLLIFSILTGLILLLGVLSVIAIGGGDMPVVISLLNSYSGLAACAAGFILLNNVLIVSGALVGASGLILTNIMCKAMNRPLSNVLFGGFGSAETSLGKATEGEVNPISAEDSYYILEAARSVIFVPGYGMAVAQAQHVARELGEMLKANGAEVKYVIHPVAGRMPGHMNVLLAEANVPYEELAEPEDVNPVMDTVDVALIVGANDVVNPAAREDESSPIYGMPIINVDQARTVIVLKRSMGTGFAGIQNPLFFKENTRMLFGDAKASITTVVTEFKEK